MNARRASPVDDDARVRREVGKRIRDRRTELGLTMKQLGERLVNSSGNPVPGTQISKWERGVNFPAKWQWSPLATALTIDLDQLFSGLVGEQPEWSVRLEARVDELAAQISALGRLVGVGDEALAAAVRAGEAGRRHLDLDQVDQDLEAERIAREREDRSGEGGNQAVGG